MNINAVNSAISCQPLKEMTFEKKHANKNKDVQDTNFECDVFAPQTQTLEQKYDLACRIAAYYKTQYENLAKTGTTEA